jgi:uroporphyrinogen decarboxylase
MMSNRELFHATMARENGDQLLYIEQGYWDGLYEDWLAEGLPPDIHAPSFAGIGERPSLFDYAETAKWAYCWFNQFYYPEPQEETIAIRDGHRIYRDRMRNTLAVRADGGASLPQQLDFAIKCRRDYDEVRDQLTGSTAHRLHLDAFVPAAQMPLLAPLARGQGDHLVSLWAHGPFAFLRDLLGVEMAITVPYDDPDWTRMLLADHLDTCREAAALIIPQLQPDLCYVWEDNAGKTGPMVSPRLFREFHLPWYKAWKSFLLDMGVPWMVVDTNGDPRPLVPLWIEGGMDCMLPWEVNAVDIRKVAEDYPKLVLCGGISKHVLEKEGVQPIDAEIERVVRPLRARGGYLLSLDHWCPRGVRLSQYEYFHRRLRDYGKANQVQPLSLL